MRNNWYYMGCFVVCRSLFCPYMFLFRLKNFFTCYKLLILLICTQIIIDGSAIVFSIMFWTWFRLPHLSIIGIFWCVCTDPINPMGIHLLCCAQNNECTITHDVICDIFPTITQDVGFHMGREQLHVFPSITFNSFCWQVDMVLTEDEICTLINFVIIDPTQTDLLSQSCAIWGFVAFDVIQAQKRGYCDQHPIDQFLPLTIEIFECLHKQVYVFLHYCANASFFFIKKIQLHCKRCKHLPS